MTRFGIRPLLVSWSLLCLGSLGSVSWAEDDPLSGPKMKRHAPGAVQLGWTYFQRGDLDTALRRFEMAVRHDSEFAPAHYGVAYVHSVRGNLEEAVKSYKETLKWDPKHVYAHANLGYALLQLEKDEEAIKELDAALKLDPKCGEAHLSYANYHAKHGRWAQAGESANRAVALGQAIHPEFRALLESNGVVLDEGNS